MKKIFFLVSLMVMIGLSCTKSSEGDKRVEGVLVDDPNSVSSMIRNPVTSNSKEIDTASLAKITFEEDRFNFGEIDEGGKLSHTFPFTNTGAVPLIISDVRSTCGCTVAEWSREPISPGEVGEISVNFDSKNKEGRQSKPITITSNTYPSKTTIYLDGFVNK